MHDLLVFAGGAVVSQILVITVSLYASVRRRRRISDRLGPPSP